MRVFGIKGLKAIVSNPLVCAMICALNEAHRETLPNDRVTLYETCIDTLIGKRDEARKILLEPTSDLK